MHWLHPTPEKQTLQGLHSRTKSEGNFSRDFGPHWDSEAFPTGGTAGKVKGALILEKPVGFTHLMVPFLFGGTLGWFDFMVKVRDLNQKLTCWVLLIMRFGSYLGSCVPQEEAWKHSFLGFLCHSKLNPFSGEGLEKFGGRNSWGLKPTQDCGQARGGLLGPPYKYL